MLCFAAPYAAILIWFARVDVYHRHFSEAGPLVFVNNVCRVLFIFYLFWMVHAAGALLLRLVAGRAVPDDGGLDSLALRFFAGTGVWHITMLALGYLSLYSRPVMIALTLPVVALSYPNFQTAVSAFGIWRREVRSGGADSTASLLKIVFVLFVAVLIIKGLYPGGGHDYFTHYFLYDRAVVERGDLWPNDVWYHYYYSKGAGLFFLAMLLTDPLAPQLVSFTFYAASLLVLFLLLRRIAPNSRWVWASLILFVGLYIYTPGSGVARSSGGWGDFEKLHELNAALILGIIWLSTRVLESRGRRLAATLAATMSAIAAAVIINTTVAAFLVAVFGLLMPWYLWKRRTSNALECAGLAAIAGLFGAATLLVNQLTTGLMSDQILGVAWKFADVEMLHRWGALLAILTTMWGRAGMDAQSTSLVGMVDLLMKTSRLEMFGPLVLCGVAFAVAARRRATAPASMPILVVAVALAVTSGFAVTTGTAQPISFYRYTSFVVPLVLLGGIALIRIGTDADGTLGRLARDPRTPWAIVAACFLTAFISYHPRRAPFDAIADGSRFAVGWYSIDKAYTTQRGWPARSVYGGIYPGARGAYAAVGPHVRIWSLHVFSYCMLPDCGIESWLSFTTTADWDRLMFDTPEAGRAALQGVGLNHFLFSAELRLDSDPLPLSPLFAPDNIARYLGIRWTDGTTTLLTWLGPGIRPLDEAWIARYRRAVSESSVHSFPLEQFRAIYARLRATPHPWRSFELPWSSRAR